MPTQSKIPNANPAKKGLPGRQQGEPGTIVPVEGPAQNTSSVGARHAVPGADPWRDAAHPSRMRAHDPASVGARADGGAAPESSNPYGPNNEQLPDRLQEALRRLVFQFSTESELSRRQEIRRIKQAHQFWRGLQYLWWSERDQNWHLPFEQKLLDNSSIDNLPRYEFVTNIYQAFGLSLVSVLSQDVPRVRFFPSSAQAEEDVSAAKAATEVAGLVERNNRIGNLIVDEAFALWTDGKVGAYVRFVVDGQRFGFHPETEIGMREVKLGSDVYVCPDCATETPAPIGDGSVGAQHAAPGANSWRDAAHPPGSSAADSSPLTNRSII